MKTWIFLILTLCITFKGFAEEDPPSRKDKKASYTYREASVLSMMGWGLGLFAAIAVLCSLVENNPAQNSTQSSTQ